MSHLRSGTPCQDAIGAVEVTGLEGPVLVAVASDGAGSAAFSREGSRAVVRGILRSAADHFATAGECPDDERLRDWIDAIRDHIGMLAEARGSIPRQFAATMVAAFATPTATCFAHVGDGGAVVDEGERWAVGSWPAGGEYAGTTYFVTDAPPVRLAITRLDRPVDALAVFTDGIEHMVLEDSERRPFAPFFDMMFGAMREDGDAGCDRALCRSLRTYLRGDTVNARTHDDKSLVLAVRR